jgi:hypothetical protein
MRALNATRLLIGEASNSTRTTMCPNILGDAFCEV